MTYSLWKWDLLLYQQGEWVWCLPYVNLNIFFGRNFLVALFWCRT